MGKIEVVDYEEEVLAEELSDPEIAIGYLRECLAFNERAVFLCALRQVVQAQSSMAEVARHLNGSRAQLYDALSAKGNPKLDTLFGVLDSIGLSLSITKKAA